MKESRIKNIVECGIYQGYSFNSTISSICFEIATESEIEMTMVTWEFSEATINKAESLYEKYKKEYYQVTQK